jgi:hypothetical protein
VEGDSRWNILDFWVGLIPVHERGVVPEEGIAIPNDLLEEEMAFLVEYQH